VPQRHRVPPFEWSTEVNSEAGWYVSREITVIYVKDPFQVRNYSLENVFSPDQVCLVLYDNYVQFRVVTIYECDYWRAMELWMDLLLNYTQLGTTSNYSAVANLHTLEITTR
jgi:hypothetical protein